MIPRAMRAPILRYAVTDLRIFFTKSFSDQFSHRFSPQSPQSIDRYHPDNLFLLCGDPDLEDLVNQMHLQANTANELSQHRVYNILRRFIQDLHECKACFGYA